MKKLALASVLLIAALAAAGGLVLGTDLFLADIRPAGLGPEGSGAASLDAIHQAHGGAERWKAVPRVSMVIEGTWHGRLVHWRLAPFLGDAPRLRLTFSPATHGDAVLAPVDGADPIFEVRGGVAFERTAAGERPGPAALPSFVDALRHLIELPFAMQTADVVRAVPDATWQERTHRRVFASWGTDAPQSDVDQYVLWQDQASGHLVRFDATGRFMAPFAVACAEFAGQFEVDGFVLPRTVVVNRGDQPGAPIMSWRIVSVELSGG